MKKKKLRRLRVFSRHPSHSVLRTPQIFLEKLTCLRLGSTTQGTQKYDVEINTPDAVKNSASKLLMKECFLKENVKTALWWIYTTKGFYNKETGAVDSIDKLPFPLVIKSFFGSRGTGNTIIKTSDELSQFVAKNNMANYIIEKFYNYNREYRLHMTEDGCFYTNRKMLKSDTPDDKRWFRNDSNSVWILEENEAFEKPICWGSIVEHSKKALKSVGLDVGAMDVRVQSAKKSDGSTRTEVDFIILECNSAPKLGEITAIKYKEIIPKIVAKKSGI